MKSNLTVHLGSTKAEHQLELRVFNEGERGGGRLEFTLGSIPGEADWVEIAPGVYSLLIAGRSYEARLATHAGVAAGVSRYTVTVGSRDFEVEVHDPRRRRHAAQPSFHQGPQEIVAPMPGKIVKILVAENQEVAQGAGLLVIEAMKMQNELRAPRPGRVEKIHAVEGKGIEAGAPLIRLI